MISFMLHLQALCDSTFPQVVSKRNVVSVIGWDSTVDAEQEHGVLPDARQPALVSAVPASH
jgi:hypothetical protein